VHGRKISHETIAAPHTIGSTSGERKAWSLAYGSRNMPAKATQRT
jgi:hypothetical protein